MKTDDLIALMAADAKKPASPFPVTRRLGPAALVGAAVALAAADNLARRARHGRSRRLAQLLDEDALHRRACRRRISPR